MEGFNLYFGVLTLLTVITIINVNLSVIVIKTPVKLSTVVSFCNVTTYLQFLCAGISS